MNRQLKLWGAGAAAFGFAGLIWEVSAARSRTGLISGRVFFYALPIAGLGWIILRWMQPRRASLAAFWATLRTSLLIAIPLLAGCSFMAAFYDPKTLTYPTAMKSDLLQLVRLQDEVFADSGKYVSRVDSSFVSSRYVSAPQIALTDDGWTGTVRHALSSQLCAIFVGRVPISPATQQREPACAPLGVKLSLGWLLVDMALVIGGLAVGTLAGAPSVTDARQAHATASGARPNEEL